MEDYRIDGKVVQLRVCQKCQTHPRKLPEQKVIHTSESFYQQTERLYARSIKLAL